MATAYPLIRRVSGTTATFFIRLSCKAPSALRFLLCVFFIIVPEYPNGESDEDP